MRLYGCVPDSLGLITSGKPGAFGAHARFQPLAMRVLIGEATRG